MADSVKVEFHVLPYAPDPEKQESVNIGVIVFEGGVSSGGRVEVRFVDDWRRAKALNPAADIPYFKALQKD